MCTFTWTHAHAHFASRRHAASVCEDGGSGDAARPADALTARAFAHDRYRYCTDRVQKTGGKYREALLRTSLVKKARGPGRGWRFGDPVPPAEGPMAQDSAHDQHISSADRVQELGSRVAPEVSTARLLGQRVRGTWEAWKASRGRDGGDARRCDARRQSLSEALVSRDTFVGENHAGGPPPVERLLKVNGRSSDELEIDSADP